ANVVSGPDLIMCWFDDAHHYPDKLVDLTELANYLGNKYGGWYDGLKGYAARGDTFIAIPLAAIGAGALDPGIHLVGFHHEL
ncbi:carbohydrate ABC transporter substrate-binding protein, partial [Rhizobium johnstonii]